MNETEKEIVAWLRREADRRSPRTDAKYLIEKLANSIEAGEHKNASGRGEHRQHSPATVKDSQ